jgi:hypothetical protein
MLPMFDTRQHLPFGHPRALQLIGDDHAWDITAAFQKLAEEFLRGVLLPPMLDQGIQHMAVLIHRPPEVVTFAMTGQKHLIQMPPVA